MVPVVTGRNYGRKRYHGAEDEVRGIVMVAVMAGSPIPWYW